MIIYDFLIHIKQFLPLHAKKLAGKVGRKVGARIIIRANLSKLSNCHWLQNCWLIFIFFVTERPFFEKYLYFLVPQAVYPIKKSLKCHGSPEN